MNTENHENTKTEVTVPTKTEVTVQEIVPPTIKISPNTMKIAKLLDEFNEMVDSMKVCMHEMEKRKSKLEKMVEKMIEKEIKEKSKPKKEKKLCGFAVPCLASDIICDFMGVEQGSFVSRIDTTRKLIQYIKENKLEDPSNKQILVPDSKLWTIFGEEARNEPKLTHFTMQKYLNKHFDKTVKKPAETPLA